ncbi:hypothetical protein [Nocardia brasiliensis]|uniref:hypothetical protein n=1 Tax=Nocardia brasiliensis TaxID=37326 RepID=UPI002456C8ED|nr:hypothetical protein [Nocardia brasiliensis]
MARDHGRLLCRIWNDKEFRALTRTAQALYAQLISQKEINNAGVLPLMVSKWAKGCDEMTSEMIIADLAVLVDARFVVVDTDTEEVLVRSFIRNDGVLKQPNVFKNALRVAEAVESTSIRAVLAAELRRLGRSDATRTAAILDPTARDPEPIANPSETLRDDVETHSETAPIPAEQNSRSNPSETLPEPRTLPEPFADPCGEGVGEGEGERSVVGHLGGSRASAHTYASAREELPPPQCPNHPGGTDAPCGACRHARQRHEAAAEEHAAVAAAAAAERAEAERRRSRQAADDRARAIAACPLGCAELDGYLDDGNGSRALCDHRAPNPSRPTLREQYEQHKRAAEPPPADTEEPDHG